MRLKDRQSQLMFSYVFELMLCTKLTPHLRIELDVDPPTYHFIFSIFIKSCRELSSWVYLALTWLKTVSIQSCMLILSLTSIWRFFFGIHVSSVLPPFRELDSLSESGGSTCNFSRIIAGIDLVFVVLRVFSVYRILGKPDSILIGLGFWGTR